MTPPLTDAAARRLLEQALRSIEPRLHRALLEAFAAWRRQADALSLAALEAAVAAGIDVVPLIFGDAADVAVRPAPALPDAAGAFAPVATPAAIAAATRAEQSLVARIAETAREARRLGDAVLPPRPPVRTMVGAPAPDPPPRRPTVTFAPGLPGAADATVSYAGQAFEYLRRDAHAGVRAAVEEGLRAGRNPRDVARSIRDVVGLGDGQARWVTNLRAELESGRYGDALARRMVRGPVRQLLAAAQRKGRTLTGAEVEKLVTSYRTTAIAERAETIARTMSLDLVRAGQLAALKAAVQRGDYAGLEVRKQWVTTLDGRERPAHRALNGRQVPLNGTWLDEGVARQVPGGWRCRCSWRPVVLTPAEAAAYPPEEPPPAPVSPARPTREPLRGEAGMLRSGGGGGGGDGADRGRPPGNGDGGDDMPAPRRAPPGSVLPAGLTAEEYSRAFADSLIAYADVDGRIIDRTGLRVVANDRATRRRSGTSKADKRGRGPFMALVARTMADPDEIFAPDTPPGGIAQRRYFARWLVGDNLVHIMAAARETEPGLWRFVTGFPMDEADEKSRADAYARRREGVRVYRRRE